ncbi:hypothetical protein [Brevibacillus laterosporus]|uniref:hypothetical protein n=1 Tax=Brevibacillus laterosporus TaxID=1465 RepID=UPI001EF16C64|nr:hypothetical protein [Brevibacillus laterosporus]MCG7319081.1 hypothetical protein [Brevibacillus laterosporus]
MGQLITTILSVILLILVQIGCVQIHTVFQMKNELLDVSFATTKFISNRGARSEADVTHAVEQFIKEEVKRKPYQLKDTDIVFSIKRSYAQDQALWSHADEFRLQMELAIPALSQLFLTDKPLIYAHRQGTINAMDYDL